MKSFCLFVFCFSMFCLSNMQAENSVDAFFHRLKTPQNGTSVRIVQDDRIVSKMKNEQEARIVEANKARTVSGFRVQIFSSNAPRTAKNEALKIETKFKTDIENVPVYISFTAPFWKVRAGDCRNYQEAVDLMNRLKTEFPTHRNSMFIVRDNVKIMM